MRRRESRHRCLPRLGHRCRRPPAQASAEAMSAARTRPMRHRRACSRSPEAREARRGQQGCARGWRACFSPMVGAGGVVVVARRARGSFGGASVQGGRADGGRCGRGHGRRRVRVEVGCCDASREAPWWRAPCWQVYGARADASWQTRPAPMLRRGPLETRGTDSANRSRTSFLPAAARVLTVRSACLESCTAS